MATRSTPVSIRYAAALGSAALYVRVRDGLGKFWNFITATWVVSASLPDTARYLSEVDDADAFESRYVNVIDVPVEDDPIVLEYVVASDSSVVGEEEVAGASAFQAASLSLPSTVDVVQMAVANLGQTEIVTSLAPPVTKAERLAALFYEPTLLALLSKHDWRWARRRATLNAVPNLLRAGWAFVYELPVDCARPVAIDLGFRGGPSPLAYDPRYPTLPGARWSIEMNDAGNGRVLCCDVPNAVLVYTAKVLDPTLWDPMFLEAFSWALAARIAMPLTGKMDLASGAVQMSLTFIDSAIAADANEALPDPASGTSEIISVRRW
jgi:hypothetical protein